MVVIKHMEMLLGEQDNVSSSYETEIDLIEGLKKGHNEAYKVLYQRYFISLCEIAYQYVNDTFMAQSATNDVIFHLWEIRESLQINISLHSYLVCAVKNRCLDIIKKESTQREIPFSVFDNENIVDVSGNTNENTVESLIEKDLEKELIRAIHNLPAECRMVFCKSRFGGMKYTEISKELNISVSTVKYHIKNALTLLSKELKSYLHIFF